MEKIEDGKLFGSINGTVVGGVQLMPGKKGFALHFNGRDQYVDFGYQGDTCLGHFVLCTRGWIAAFWVQLETPGILMDTGSWAHSGEMIAWYDGVFGVVFTSGNNLWLVKDEAIPEQVWIHVAVTWRACYGATLYINGEMRDNFTTTGNHSNEKTSPPCFVLGASCNYGVMFQGKLDELRVWDAVMSDEHILELYNEDAGLNNDDAGLN